MKKHSMFISWMLTVICVFSLFNASIIAFAMDGEGTVENPYLIKTAVDLQNVNNNLSASYKLANNINLKSVEFTPIGNTETGSFKGLFDGNGFTINNLTVRGGKHGGLFACNEGTVRNVTLGDIDVSGLRYVGGLVGENAKSGVIEDCTILSGKVEGGTWYFESGIGGVCGINRGEIKGTITNSANCSNTSTIASNEDIGALGGICALNEGVMNGVMVNNGRVSCAVSPGYHLYVGGVLGYGKTVNAINWTNNGDIFTHEQSTYRYYGGIIGGCDALSALDVVNNGSIIIDGEGHNYYCGGICGGCSTAKLENALNTGIVDSFDYWDRDMQSGSMIGTVGNRAELIKCCNSAFSWTDCMVYGSDNKTTYYDCVDLHSISIRKRHTVSGYVEVQYLNISDNGALGNMDYLRYSPSSVYLNGNFSELDYNNTWSVNSEINNGLPYLKDMHPELMLNYSNISVLPGESVQLKAFVDNVIENNVEWTTIYGNARVKKNGNLTVPSSGYSVIQAIDDKGNSAYCCVYCMDENDSVFAEDFSCSYSTSPQFDIYFTDLNRAHYDFLTSVVSSDESVVRINSFQSKTASYGDSYLSSNNKSTVSCSAISTGVATISFRTKQGLTGSCQITVTEDVQSLKLNDQTINCGETKRLLLSSQPTIISNEITFQSTDPTVASVDQEGNVTGVSAGSTVITATADNGVSTYCTVIVKSPAIQVSFEQPEYSLYRGDSMLLAAIIDPDDSTDTVSYKSSNTSVATINSTTGQVSARNVGTTVITATATGGVKGYCMIRVRERPIDAAELSLDIESVSLNPEEYYQLHATITPSTTTDKTIIWTSTDPSIATVSNTGFVTAVSSGKTIITAETKNGLLAYCVITVLGTANTNHSRIYIPDIITTSEEFIEVPIMIQNNPGISFAALTVNYDKQKLEPLTVSAGDVFQTVLGSLDEDGSKISLVLTSDSNVTEDGILARIKFRVIDNSSPTEIQLFYLPNDIQNEENFAVEINLQDAVVEQGECEHQHQELINIVEATCMDDGYTGDLYCNDCESILTYGSVVSKDTVPHSWEEQGVVVAPPTCEVDGRMMISCTVCGTTKEQTIPALGHVDDNNDGRCDHDNCGEQMTGGDHCKYCGQIHGGAFGWLVKFFHSILALFKR